jgi:hypothetical protein
VKSFGLDDVTTLVMWTFSLLKADLFEVTCNIKLRNAAV